MAQYLADTHVFIWYINEPDKLSSAYEGLLDTTPNIYLSMASLWEMAIKAGKGKLDLPENIGQTATELGFTLLSIAPEHTAAVRTLPQHHHDPFDRMLIAQAMVEGLTILSSDRHFSKYDVPVA